jgi:Fe2+ or Zn2+ uptake regulation protein
MAVAKQHNLMVKNNLQKIRSNRKSGLGSLGKLRIRILDYLTKMGQPVSTSMIYAQIKSWKDVGVGYPRLMRILFELKDQGYLLLFKNRKGRFWTPAF